MSSEPDVYSREEMFALGYELVLFLRRVDETVAMGAAAGEDEEPEAPGCRYAATMARGILDRVSPGDALRRDFGQLWDRVRAEHPDAYRQLLDEPGSINVAMPGAPDLEHPHAPANVTTVQVLLYLEALLRRVEGRPAAEQLLSAADVARLAPGLAAARAFVRARLSVRDPRSEVERRLRASATTPGSRSIIRRGGW